jgi:DMSO/TMAO reductase YedYZ molybdopterin-dependent catalytic subunit
VFEGAIQMQKKFSYTFAIITITALLLSAPIQPAAAANLTKLEITDLSGTTFVITPEELAAMPKTYVYSDLFCYGYLVSTGNWGGIQLSYLLSQANLTAEVSSVQFEASDGYKVVIPIALALEPQVIVAYEKDEESLLEGYRLILPDLNGATWIAYITSLSMLTSSAKYPEVVSSAPPSTSSGQSPQINNPTSTPQPTQKPTPTQQPTPTSAPSNNQAEPITTPQAVQPTPTPQITNSNFNVDDVLLYAIVVASAVSLTVAAALMNKHKARKLKSVP